MNTSTMNRTNLAMIDRSFSINNKSLLNPSNKMSLAPLQKLPGLND